MTPRAFTPLDVCRILKASKGLMLKSLEYGDLKILFHHTSSKESGEEVTTKTLAGQLEEPNKEPEALIPKEELHEILQEIEQENFALTDPAAYERELLDERLYGAGESGEPNGRGTEARRS